MAPLTLVELVESTPTPVPYLKTTPDVLIRFNNPEPTDWVQQPQRTSPTIQPP